MASGDRLYAAEVAGRTIKRGRRVTATGNITTTETGVLRVDDIPVFADRAYMIKTSNVNLDASVANDIADARVRVTQNAAPGTAATTSSTQIGHFRNTIDDAAQSNVNDITAFYFPSSDGYLSVLLTAQRVTGTGNIVVFCSSVEILDLVIMDIGEDPGDTGVVI